VLFNYKIQKIEVISVGPWYAFNKQVHDGSVFCCIQRLAVDLCNWKIIGRNFGFLPWLVSWVLKHPQIFLFWGSASCCAYLIKVNKRNLLSQQHVAANYINIKIKLQHLEKLLRKTVSSINPQISRSNQCLYLTELEGTTQFTDTAFEFYFCGVHPVAL
jgi:hypothetical protein